MSQVLMDEKACPLKGQCQERTNIYVMEWLYTVQKYV